MSRNIIRKARTKRNPYAQILRTAIQNPELSLKSKGLLAYILSLPNNWVIHQRELTKHFSDGEFAVRAAMKELEKAGHIRGTRLRDEKGVFQGYEYVVFEDPNLKDELKPQGYPDHLTRYDRDPMYRQDIDTIGSE
jgi:hypothetical protein